MKTSHERVPRSIPRVAAAQLFGHDGPVQAVIFTADGKYCLTGGNDRSVRLWNPSRIDPAHPHPRTLPPGPPGPSLLTSLGSLPHALPIQTYTDGLTHPISAIAVDDKSTTLLAASDKTLVVSDVVTKKVKRRFQGHAGRINAVAVSDGCETYLSASYDATVRIWDGRSNSYEPIQILKGAKDSVTSVHVVQEKEAGVGLIRTASVDGCVRTYDVRKGTLQVDDCGQAITSIVPTHDKQCLVISCLDGLIRLMDLDSGELLNTYEAKHVAGQYALEVCLTADDATIVSGSEDGSAVLYDLVKGCQVQSLQGHQRPTCSVATHPKKEHNSVVITASYDGSAVVWANDSSFVEWKD